MRRDTHAYCLQEGQDERKYMVMWVAVQTNEPVSFAYFWLMLISLQFAFRIGIVRIWIQGRM